MILRCERIGNIGWRLTFTISVQAEQKWRTIVFHCGICRRISTLLTTRKNVGRTIIRNWQNRFLLSRNCSKGSMVICKYQSEAAPKFGCLIKLEGVYAKRPSDEVVQKMTELFPATKCICFLTQDSKLCDCDENGKIPEPCHAFFMDQIGPRILRLQCDCNDDHKVRIPLQGNPRSNDRGHLNHSDVVRVIFFFT